MPNGKTSRLHVPGFEIAFRRSDHQTDCDNPDPQYTGKILIVRIVPPLIINEPGFETLFILYQILSLSLSLLRVLSACQPKQIRVFDFIDHWVEDFLTIRNITENNKNMTTLPFWAHDVTVRLKSEYPPQPFYGLSNSGSETKIWVPIPGHVTSLCRNML